VRLTSSVTTARVKAGYRIHLGFYRFSDPPFIYGSLGASILNPGLELVMHTNQSDELIIESPTQESKDLINYTIKSVYPSFRGYVRVEGFIEHHIGLGTRTRLILACLTALRKLGIIGSINELIDKAHKLGIGKYSAVGLYTFLKGGLVIDTGKEIASPHPPKLLIRFPVPMEWRVILALPMGIHGLPEHTERPIMDKPRAFSKQKDLYSSVLTLMYSLEVKDFELFTKSIDRIQELTGQYFSRYQGGIFCCDESEFIADELKKRGLEGVGQSSWGPLVYGFTNSSKKAKNIAKSLRNNLREVGVSHVLWVTDISRRGYLMNDT